jgi:hypothetical protein
MKQEHCYTASVEETLPSPGSQQLLVNASDERLAPGFAGLVTLE